MRRALPIVVAMGLGCWASTRQAWGQQAVDSISFTAIPPTTWLDPFSADPPPTPAATPAAAPIRWRTADFTLSIAANIPPQRPDALVDANDPSFFSLDPDTALRPPSADDPGLGAFLLLDRVAGHWSEAQDRLSAGLTWTGLVPSRRRDVLGAAITYRRPLDRAGIEESAVGAASVEGFYQLRLTPWITLVPDVQYLSSWEGRTHQDAVVVSVQLEIEF